MLTLFWSHASRLYVSASLGHLLEVIAVWKLTNGANRVRFEPGAIVSGSSGAIGAFGSNHHLRQSLAFLNVPTMQQPEAYVSHVDKIFDEHGQLVSDGTRKFLQAFMQAFANWVKTIRS